MKRDVRTTSDDRRITEGQPRLGQIIHEDTLDFFYPSQSTIISIEARRLVADGRGELNGIGCTEAIASP